MKTDRMIHYITAILLFLLPMISANAQQSVGNDSTTVDPFAGWTDEQIDAYEDSIIQSLYPQPKVIERSEEKSIGFNMVDKHTSSSTTPRLMLNSVIVDQTKAVGQIDINSGMTPSGAKTYSIPIHSYSVNGKPYPGISLNYNSQRGKSIAGVGWNIGGISVITRGKQTIFYDPETGTRASRLSALDAFFLDGKRLILKSGPSVFTYETETGQIRVLTRTRQNKVTTFEVYYPNGNHAVFGFPDNTEDQLLYPITSLTDPKGNTITYSYTENNGYYDIASVSYNGAEILFNYTVTRPDPLNWYCAGKKTVINHLLSSITCKLAGQVMCEYSFTYETRDNTSLLSRVDYQSGGSSLNPLLFTYGNGTNSEQYTHQSHSLKTKGYDDVSLCRVRKARLDYGSSSDDVVVFPIKDPYWNKKRHKTAFRHSQNYLQNQYTGNEDIFIYPESGGYESLKTGEGFVDLLVADLYGDQQECLVRINNTVDGNNDKVTFTVYRKGSSGLTQALVQNFYNQTVYTDNDDKKSIQPKRYFAGDFKGNGKMQIMAVSAANALGESDRPTKCYIYDVVAGSCNERSGQFTYSENLFGTNQSDADSVEYYSDRMMAVDFNGDGKADLCHISSSGMLIFTDETSGFHSTATYAPITRTALFKKRILPCELNGDGLTDFLITPSYDENSSSTTWNSYVSKGNGTFDTSSLTGPGTHLGALIKYDFQVQDVNQDGISEILKTSSNNITTYKLLGGSLQYSCNTTVTGPSAIAAITPMTHNHFGRLTTIGNDLYVDKFLYQKNARKDMLITGMTNSYGVVENNSYVLGDREYSDSWYCTKGTGAQYPYVNILEPIQLLTGTSIYMNGNQIDSHTYRYRNGVSHREGLGFCGFTTIVETDRNGMELTRSYNPIRYSVLTAEESNAYKNEYEYEIREDGRIRNILLTGLTHTDKLSGATLNTTYEHDTYGYVTKETSEASDDITTVRSYSYAHRSDYLPTNYRLGFITGYSKTVNRPNNHAFSTYSGNTEVTQYTENRLPLAVNTYINGNLAAHKEFTYDADGNVLSESIRQFDSSNTLTTTFTYDSYGRVLSTTSPMGFTSSVAYNSRGQVASRTDHLGNSAVFSYDDLDRTVSVSLPDNTVRTTAYEWASPADNGLFKTVTTATGEPEQTVIYDALGREVSTVNEVLNGLSYTNKVYDANGRLWKESLPHGSNGTVKWNVYEYDDYGRPVSVTDALGMTTSYAYQNMTVTITDSNNKTIRKTLDSQGNTVQTEGDEGNIHFGLTATGQPHLVGALPNGLTGVFYDNYGRRVLLDAPGMGGTTYEYDDDGNLSRQTNARGETIAYEYDQYGWLTDKVMPEQSTTYTYNTMGLLSAVTSDNGTGKTFTYDSLGRISSRTSTAPDGKWLREDFTYADGNVSSITYTSQSGVLTTENYTYEDGTLKRITLADGTVVYELETVNAQDLPTAATTGQLNRSYIYSDTGSLTSQQTCRGTSSPIQHTGYSHELQTGNLLSRTDNLRGVTEHFEYDTENRLTVYGPHTVGYMPGGNIGVKSDVGGYEYALQYQNPNAVTGVVQNGSVIPLREQDISYTSFARPDTISENGKEAVFTYDDEGNRMRMTVTTEVGTVLTRYYLGGSYEMDVVADGSKEKLYLGGGYYSSPAVLIKDNTGSHIYYVLRDHLGSITHVVNTNGDVVQELSYDPWGRLRNPETHEGYAADSIPELFLGRGFTGHEHLTEFGLINMNARLYDPVLGRFLSPDPQVQDMDNLQSLNRYSYCLNNPLVYVDPTGETVWETWQYNLLQEFDYHYRMRMYLQMQKNPSEWWLFGDKDGYAPNVLYYDDVRHLFMKWVNGAFCRLSGELVDASWYTYPGSQNGTSGYDGRNSTSVGGGGYRGTGSNVASNIHNTLDIVGLIPGCDIADLINAGMYLLEGNYQDAIFSTAAVIPVVGNVATAGKVGGKVTNNLNKRDIINWLHNVEEISPAQLRKDLESVGFVRQNVASEHYLKRDVLIRLEGPDINTPYNHMHINIGPKRTRRYNTYDINLKPVNFRSRAAHIKIK